MDDEARPPQAIHRIGLKPDGSKLGKKMLGQVGGCAVKLDADENVEEGLGVCEGFETALNIRATGWRPIWALGSAGAIRAAVLLMKTSCAMGGRCPAHFPYAWIDIGRHVVGRTPRPIKRKNRRPSCTELQPRWGYALWMLAAALFGLSTAAND